MCGIWVYLGSPADKKELIDAFWSLEPRGPDNSHFCHEGKARIGFHRLSINDASDHGTQPMHRDGAVMVCNGEIYNCSELRDRYGLECHSGSDCEAVIQLYNYLVGNADFGSLEAIVKHLCRELDGEFSFVIYDKNLDKVIVARDRYGVRPLFVGSNSADDHVGFASELKGLDALFEEVEQFEPSTFAIYDATTRERTKTSYNVIRKSYHADICTERQVIGPIREALTCAVRKRLMSDRPMCALLSGGLDSSVVCAILSQFYEPFTLHTFSIGLRGSIDLEYARIVADHIQSIHHEVVVTEEEVLESIPETVRVIESYDITSVRASAFNRLIAKYIRENTAFKVVLTGEMSDEVLGGYMYFKHAPDPQAFHDECNRLVEDVCYFDNLRADRCISSNGLEARVPFSDTTFVELVQCVDPALKMCSGDRQEKYLLRKAFDVLGKNGLPLLPHSVLWRTKSAFSDGVSVKQRSWHNVIKERVDALVSDKEFETESVLFEHNTPRTKEAYYYRKIFSEHYRHDRVIPYFWMPRFTRDGEEATDPSARELGDDQVA
jgi:asparagine synthase (glutamine-hydrolysing)